ncbi:Chromatin structure-remodeling complex protein rsc9 [Hypoxylon texense]
MYETYDLSFFSAYHPSDIRTIQGMNVHRQQVPAPLPAQFPSGSHMALSTTNAQSGYPGLGQGYPIPQTTGSPPTGTFPSHQMMESFPGTAVHHLQTNVCTSTGIPNIQTAPCPPFSGDQLPNSSAPAPTTFPVHETVPAAQGYPPSTVPIHGTVPAAQGYLPCQPRAQDFRHCPRSPAVPMRMRQLNMNDAAGRPMPSAPAPPMPNRAHSEPNNGASAARYRNDFAQQQRAATCVNNHHRGMTVMSSPLQQPTGRPYVSQHMGQPTYTQPAQQPLFTQPMGQPPQPMVHLSQPLGQSSQYMGQPPQPVRQPSQQGKRAPRKRRVAKRGAQKPRSTGTGANESGPSTSGPAAVSPVASTAAAGQKRAAEEDVADPRPQKRAQTEDNSRQSSATITQEEGLDGSIEEVPVENFFAEFFNGDEHPADCRQPETIDGPGSAADPRQHDEERREIQEPQEAQEAVESPTNLEQEVSQRHAMESTAAYLDWGLEGNSHADLEDFFNNVTIGLTDDWKNKFGALIRYNYVEKGETGNVFKCPEWYKRQQKEKN